MDREARKEELRYRVWLFQHAPEYLKENHYKKGYSEAPNRDYLDPIPCKECNRAFQREVPWQRRCDNCIKSDILEPGITYNEYRVTSLGEVFNGNTLKMGELPASGPSGVIDNRRGPVENRKEGEKLCKKCRARIVNPTPGCSECYHYTPVYKPIKGAK